MSDKGDDNHAGSVTRLLVELKHGDDDAAQRLWDRYFDRMTREARRLLRASQHPLIDQDEEDVALSAMQEFFQGARQGRFPILSDRTDLWRLLIHLTACKAIDQLKRRGARRRGGGRVRLESDEATYHPKTPGWSLDHLTDHEPSPGLKALIADEVRRRVESLPDAELRQIALMKLAGHTHEEIRDELGCSLRTVGLKLAVIRKRWESEALT